jgi:hypothetical protein
MDAARIGAFLHEAQCAELYHCSTWNNGTIRFHSIADRMQMYRHDETQIPLGNDKNRPQELGWDKCRSN